MACSRSGGPDCRRFRPTRKPAARLGECSGWTVWGIGITCTGAQSSRTSFSRSLTEKTESQSTEEVIAKISELETLVTGDSIKNFKSIRQLRESYQKEWAQFLREIQIRGAGDRLWTIFTELIGSAALHLLAARLRRDRCPFSGLAQSIQAQLW